MKAKNCFLSVFSCFCVILTFMLHSCSGESFHEIIIEPSHIMFRFDNSTHEATAYGYKFSDGNIIKDLTLPADINVVDLTYKVVIIADGAFASGPWISVSLGANIHTIGKKAFSNCTDIKTITIEGNDLPLLPDDAFEQTVYDNATLVIGPEADVKGTAWEKFANISRL